MITLFIILFEIRNLIPRYSVTCLINKFQLYIYVYFQISNPIVKYAQPYVNLATKNKTNLMSYYFFF